jgi:hypothetical protein
MSAWRIGAEAGALASESAGNRARYDEPAFGGPGTPQAPPSTSEASDMAFQAVFDRLAKWIPGDTLLLYVPGVTLISASSGDPSVAFLVVMIIVTPLFVLAAAFAAAGTIAKSVWLAALLGAAAFAIWSMSVPLSGWQKWHVVANNSGAFALTAAVIGILFAYVAEGLSRRLVQQ